MTKDRETKNSIEYTYNTLNQLTKFNSDDMIYQYGYDKNGNLSWAYDAKLVNFNYEITYNKANLPKRIETTFDSKNYDYTLSYWLNGQKFLEQDTVNNVWTEYDYNSLGQLELELKQANNKTVCERGYTYDASGNRTQMRSWNADAGKWDEITDYTYDANNRLTNEITKTNDEITSAVRYYYDRNGNMTSEQSKVYTTEGTESSNMGLSGRIGGGSAKVYTYDRFNRLMQYNDGATEATYTYGADNLRASKTVNGTKTEFVWNGQNLASETTDDVMTIYSYDMTGVLGSKKDGEAEIRYHKDPHGNVLAMERNNTLEGEYTYDAFGNQLTTAEIDNPFRYCGEYFDKESGNIYLRNRYYDTRTGRFINEDPIRDGLNWYVYCGNNPVMCIDPSGLNIFLIGTKEENDRTLSQLQMLTNDKLNIDKDTSSIVILEEGTMNTDKKLFVGSLMLRDLINNKKFNVNIKRDNIGQYGCDTSYNQDGVTIMMNDWCEQGNVWNYEVSDGKNTVLEDHKDVAHIMLGHELIHAVYKMDKTPNNLYYGWHYYVDNNGNGKIQEAKKGVFSNEEFDVVGLDYFELEYTNGILTAVNSVKSSLNGLTENALRAEQGLRPRVGY